MQASSKDFDYYHRSHSDKTMAKRPWQKTIVIKVLGWEKLKESFVSSTVHVFFSHVLQNLSLPPLQLDLNLKYHAFINTFEEHFVNI